MIISAERKRSSSERRAIEGKVPLVDDRAVLSSAALVAARSTSYRFMHVSRWALLLGGALAAGYGAAKLARHLASRTRVVAPVAAKVAPRVAEAK